MPDSLIEPKRTHRMVQNRTGGELIVDVLAEQGVERIFGVPGESFLAVLDALVDQPSVKFVLARQEGGATMMADADGKLTGRPGVAIVTRGPGITNGASGIHVAFQDSTPMLVLVGLIGRGETEREAFQEIDLKAVFGTQTKWTATIDDAARVPELLTRAFQTAMSGRPGPVVIGLPEDMLRDAVAGPIAIPARAEPVQAAPSGSDMETFIAHLRQAERPFVILGGGTWDQVSWSAFRDFAERWQLPVGTSFRALDRFDHSHPCYAGDVGLGINPALKKIIQESDLLIVLGARLGDCTTQGYSLIDVPVPDQRLIHIHPDPDEPGRVYAPTLGIAAGVRPFVKELKAYTGSAPAAAAWAKRTASAREAFKAWTAPQAAPGKVNLSEIVDHLSNTLPDDAIVTNGAGNYSMWVHRFFRFKGFRHYVAPTSGSMGYGLPAAVAAKLRHPDRPVICFAGDGCFQMTCQEFGTACETGAALIVLVCNNSMYGTIRMHQERDYPARVSGTGLFNPDFAALARAYGAPAATVTETAQFPAIFNEMLASGKPALIELKLDPEAITPHQTITGLRAGS